jgi:L-asparaginase
VGAAQCLPPGVYLAMNGRVFDPRRVHKNLARQAFEECGDGPL